MALSIYYSISMSVATINKFSRNKNRKSCCVKTKKTKREYCEKSKE